MVDTAPAPEPVPTRTERATSASRRIGAALASVLRLVVTGDRVGRLRRKGLFSVVAVALIADGTGGVILGGFGLIALLFLAMTDDVVDLS